jgi:glycosyltransferase involved in cell wall biosynthesis
VENNKSSIWAEYIYLLMKNKELSEQMGSNGYKKLVHEYNVGKHIGEFEKLYNICKKVLQDC